MKKQIIDQAGHVVGAMLALMIPLLFPYGFVVGGFLIGFIREQGQHYISEGPASWKFWKWEGDSWLDIAFWTTGGAIVEFLFVTIFSQL